MQGGPDPTLQSPEFPSPERPKKFLLIGGWAGGEGGGEGLEAHCHVNTPSVPAGLNARGALGEGPSSLPSRLVVRLSSLKPWPPNAQLRCSLKRRSPDRPQAPSRRIQEPLRICPREVGVLSEPRSTRYHAGWFLSESRRRDSPSSLRGFKRGGEWLRLGGRRSQKGWETPSTCATRLSAAPFPCGLLGAGAAPGSAPPSRGSPSALTRLARDPGGRCASWSCSPCHCTHLGALLLTAHLGFGCLFSVPDAHCARPGPF